MARNQDYGRGAEGFLAYAKTIAEHPVYQGMPDVYGNGGEIQWEAPSNRSSGKFQHTHQKRREWWQRKAEAMGIDWKTEAAWISRVAKAIHPTKMKPCKKCGLVLTIRYAYPSNGLLKGVRDLPYVAADFPLNPNEHIAELVTRLVDTYGARVFSDLPKLLKTSAVAIPPVPSRLDAWLDWLDKVYIPAEPGKLSPGAMSNAPDRFDGFHSLNRCCRGTSDPGRAKENMQSYSTDRRVFEYWVDGDWVAADRLMGLVRSHKDLKTEACVNGHPGPCSADHIGPISLGFAHRPEFQFLCKGCNSAKNNRMGLSDVARLRRSAAEGTQVASWSCQALWDARKDSVDSNETALRLSKLLRDNRHTVMELLHRLAQAGHYTFLTTLLHLNYAEHDPTFVNLRAENHVTKYDQLIPGSRTTKYAAEQKARRIRIAFKSLSEYHEKETRNSYVISSPAIEAKLGEALELLASSPEPIRAMDRELRDVVGREGHAEEELRGIAERLPAVVRQGTNFPAAKRSLEEAMDLVAQHLSGMWTHERYVRSVAEDDEL